MRFKALKNIKRGVDTSFLFSLGLALFFSLIAISNAKAEGTLFLDERIGFYCEEVASSSYSHGGRYLVDGNCTAHYIGFDLPSGKNWYGDLYKKIDGSRSELLNGHSLSTLTDFDKIENENFTVATTSSIYFITIYDYSSCGLSLREYLEDTSINNSPANCEWGTLLWTDLPVWVGEWSFGLPPPPEPDFTDKDFGILGNYFRDVLVWLFYPSNYSIDRFASLKDTLESKSPFGYFLSIKNSLSSLSSSGVESFDLSSSFEDNNINDEILFSTIKTGLGWCIWLLFSIWFIRRIKDFHI